MFSVNKLNVSTIKKPLSISISPIVTKSPFSIPDSPRYISINTIQKLTNIHLLKKIEYEYDEFLEKRFQVLLLLNLIDEVLDIRDSLISRIISLQRRQRLMEMKNSKKCIL